MWEYNHLLIPPPPQPDDQIGSCSIQSGPVRSIARRQSIKVRSGPAGIQIFDRSTGLNVLLDEITVPPKLWDVCPRYVSIALTNACDLGCPYCYAPKHAAVLDFQRVVRWLHQLDDNGCLGVGFGGGEPTLYPRIADLCRYTAQRTGLAVTLTTHGHRLDDSLLASIKGNIHFLRISMDGIGATYEQCRRRSFKNLCERLKSVRRIVPFGINYVVNAQTLPDLDEATVLANSLGATEFLLLPEQATQNGGGIDRSTSDALRRWVISYGGKVPLTVSEAGADGLPTCNPVERENGLRAYAFISASGLLMKSSFDQDGIAIRDNGLVEALATLRQQHGEECE